MIRLTINSVFSKDLEASFLEMLCCVYIKAFVQPHFHYCSLIWHFCGAGNRDKLELLNKRTLIFNDVNSSYDELAKTGQHLCTVEKFTTCLLQFLTAYSSVRKVNILRNGPLFAAPSIF